MPTKSEAAEALYRAAKSVAPGVGGWDWCFTPAVRDEFQSLCRAIDAYSTATPDAVPPEVQRVVEAAGALRARCARPFDNVDVDAAIDAICDAVDAYRSTQPEPLNARLARLGKGAVVKTEMVPHFDVLANSPEHRCLFCHSLVYNFPKAVPYHDVTAIVSGEP